MFIEQIPWKCTNDVSTERQCSENKWRRLKNIWHVPFVYVNGTKAYAPRISRTIYTKTTLCSRRVFKMGWCLVEGCHLDKNRYSSFHTRTTLVPFLKLLFNFPSILLYYCLSMEFWIIVIFLFVYRFRFKLPSVFSFVNVKFEVRLDLSFHQRIRILIKNQVTSIYHSKSLRYKDRDLCPTFVESILKPTNYKTQET